MSKAGTMMKGAAVASLLMLATAGPAWAHAEFEGAAVPPDTHQELALHVPGERPDAHNVEVVVELPAEFELHSCEVAPGWSCTAESATGNRTARVTFRRLEETKSGHHHATAVPAHAGDPAPPPPPADEPAPAPGDEADMFRFGVHTAAQPGSYSFVVEQQHSDGETVTWDGDAGSNQPAPVLSVEDPAA
jgi:uncharacterized protein YcnI